MGPRVQREMEGRMNKKEEKKETERGRETRSRKGRMMKKGAEGGWTE